MQLFNGKTTDGVSSWVAAISDAYNGLINVYVVGDLGGGTLTLEALAPDGVTAVPVSNGYFGSPEARVISSASIALRAKLAGSAAPNVSVWIEVEDVKLRSAVRGRV